VFILLSMIRDIKKVRQTSGNPEYPVVSVTLTKAIREESGIRTGDRVLLEATGGRIVITKEKTK
jgi:hypothetical protein